jgi:hypothetical protein
LSVFVTWLNLMTISPSWQTSLAWAGVEIRATAMALVNAVFRKNFMMNLFITIIIDSVAGLLIYDIANLVPNNNSLINMIILS